MKQTRFYTAVFWRRSWFIILPAALLMACGGGRDKRVNDGNLNATDMADTCDCTQLVSDSTTGLHTLDGAPFTGVCISYYENSDSKYVQENLLEGKLHGTVTYYAKSGEVLFEEVYEAGEQKRLGAVDQAQSCDCDELEKVKTKDPLYPVIARLNDIPFTGRCEKKYDGSDQLYMESHYKRGLLHGYTIFYYRDGSNILMEKYENGELISTVN